MRYSGNNYPVPPLGTVQHLNWAIATHNNDAFVKSVKTSNNHKDTPNSIPHLLFPAPSRTPQPLVVAASSANIFAIRYLLSAAVLRLMRRKIDRRGVGYAFEQVSGPLSFREWLRKHQWGGVRQCGGAGIVTKDDFIAAENAVCNELAKNEMVKVRYSREEIEKMVLIRGVKSNERAASGEEKKKKTTKGSSRPMLNLSDCYEEIDDIEEEEEEEVEEVEVEEVEEVEVEEEVVPLPPPPEPIKRVLSSGEHKTEAVMLLNLIAVDGGDGDDGNYGDDDYDLLSPSSVSSTNDSSWEHVRNVNDPTRRWANAVMQLPAGRIAGFAQGDALSEPVLTAERRR